MLLKGAPGERTMCNLKPQLWHYKSYIYNLFIFLYDADEKRACWWESLSPHKLQRERFPAVIRDWGYLPIIVHSSPLSKFHNQ